MNDLMVQPIPSKVARGIVEAEHYLHRKPPVSFCFGLLHDGDLMGVVTFGTPPSRHLQKGVCPSDPSLVTELNRLWVDDDMPKNSESWFVSRALKQLPPRIVVSYADTSYGHKGYVYRSLNFKYAGWTDMDRKTPRLDYVPADPNVHSRDAYRNGWDHIEYRKPKVKYWTTTGDKRQRRYLDSLCQWHDLSWKELPPPSEHKQHKL